MRGNIQLEKGVCNLQHEDVWMIVFMADQDSLAGSAHAMFLVVLFQSLQACEHRGILLWLVLFRTEGVIAERVQADSRGLVCVERPWNDRSVCLVLL